MDKLQDIIVSMGNPANLLVSSLSSYRPVPNGRRGFLRAVGGYCVVIPLKKAEEIRPTKCIRFWYGGEALDKEFQDFQSRLSTVMARDREVNIYFCRQDYFEKALRLSDGTVIPAVVMAWAPHSLDQWLSSADKPISFEYASMARQMRELSAYLKANGISHGDISPANILVGADLRIRLTDFDSLDWSSKGLDCCMPSIAGARNFNRPERAGRQRSGNDDCLALQLIHFMLLLYSKRPELNAALPGDEALLFDVSSLASLSAFRSSDSYKAASAMGNPEINHYLKELERALSAPYDEMKALCDIVFKGSNTRRARLILAPYCGGCGNRFLKDDEFYCRICRKLRHRIPA